MTSEESVQVFCVLFKMELYWFSLYSILRVFKYILNIIRYVTYKFFFILWLIFFMRRGIFNLWIFFLSRFMLLVLYLRNHCITQGHKYFLLLSSSRCFIVLDFLQLYWGIIDIHNCIYLRCTMWWFDTL